MQTLTFLLKISRFRFWMYTAGPYLLGYLIGSPNLITAFYSAEFIFYFLYFLVPANIFLYGVNDYFDEDTDKFNPKKGTKEHKLKNSNKGFLKLILAICLILSLALIFFIQTMSAKIALSIFVFLSYFYSAPPLRFKSKPLLDSISNVLYIIPGVISYLQVSGQLPPTWLLIGFWCWASSMHLFSAVPDIEADKKARLKTTAVFLGKNASLIVCAILWLIFTLITITTFKNPLFLTLFIYPAIPLLIFLFKNLNIEKIYWYFPYLNTLIGFIAFLLIVESKMYGN